MPEVRKLIHPPWPTKDEHLFGPWEPMDRGRKYRICIHPDCGTMEVSEVKG